MLVRRTVKSLKVCLGACLLQGLITVASAQGDDQDRFYCQERKLGQYFYCRDPKPAEEETVEPTVVTSVPESSAQTTSVEKLAEIRKQLDEMRAQAILNPSQENVRDYIAFQRVQLDRASAFSDSWRRVIWSTPSLDYTLQRPVSTLAKRQWGDQRTADQRELLANLSERYGVFYFYAASCSACTQFSPVLRSFTDKYDIPVKAVSVDGGASEHFPGAVRDQGHMDKMGLGGSPTPALALFDTQTKGVIPIGFGFMSQSELEERIFILTQTETGEDF